MRLACALGLLCLRGALSAGRHYLWYLGTLVVGSPELPELSGVGVVDGVQVEYYNSAAGELVSRRDWRPGGGAFDDAEDREAIVRDFQRDMRRKLAYVMGRFNHSAGVHTYQRISGCELDEGGAARFRTADAYDGQGLLTYDMERFSYSPLDPGAIYDKLFLEGYKIAVINVYQPMCLKLLKRYLEQDGHVLMRRVKPRVRVFQKTSAFSGGTEVTCLATGFYPRALELTLLRDGRPVPEQELTGGEVLPNGDGTYQLRKTLALSEEEEERRERHRYTCRVQHSGLDNGLEVDWGEDLEPDAGFIAVVVMGVLAVALVLPVAACVLRRKKGRGKEQSETSSNSSGP
ncbi:class I histocompatibility antigen, F10 alpha chain-like [Lepisosteus oculatus]|uniref:class I histocompatibility antigen, F10 alpha chain-like n=1 Tax=Lepisosteus oculatus TaxID=7918 RepID=UPI0035F51D90